MRKEKYTYKERVFEIKTVSQANSFEDTDLIVILKYNGKLLEFYHADSETVGDYKFQKHEDLENCLYEIAKQEIECKFFERVEI